MSKFKVGQQVRVTIPAEAYAGFDRGDIGTVVEEDSDDNFAWLIESDEWPDRLWFEATELEAVK